MTTLDLNSDLGESFGRWVLGDDEAMLGLVTSANVACGFHAGDPTTLRRTCVLAAEAGVVVGAQVGYRDLAGFGRRFVDVAPNELADDVVYQIGALDGMCRVAGTAVRYVKPHGALYNAIVHHEAQAAAVVAAVRDYSPELPVLGLPGSAFLRAAEKAGLRTVREFFVDRGYTPDGHPGAAHRGPGALLHDPDEVTERVLRLVSDGCRGGGRRQRRRRRRPSRRACTATRRAPSRWRRAVRAGLEKAGVALRAFA